MYPRYVEVFDPRVEEDKFRTGQIVGHAPGPVDLMHIIRWHDTGERELVKHPNSTLELCLRA